MQLSRDSVHQSSFELRFIPADRFVRLDASPATLFLSAAFDIDGAASSHSGTAHATISRYTVALLDSQGRELIAYHLHPAGASPIRYPHLHIARLAERQIAQFDRPWLSRAHWPTGTLQVADFVRMLITELGVTPK